jgi:hypothetical protein
VRDGELEISVNASRPTRSTGWFVVWVAAVACASGCGRKSGASNAAGGRDGSAGAADGGAAGYGGSVGGSAAGGGAAAGSTGGMAAGAGGGAGVAGVGGGSASDGSAADASDAANDAGPTTDARDAAADARDGDPGTDAHADVSADTQGDGPPDGIGGCSESSLLSQTTTMMNGWTRPTRVCEPSQSSTDSWTGFSDGVTTETCAGSECGSAGTCAVDIDWLTPFSVKRDQTGKLQADAKLHLDPRCSIRYTHGADSCLCVVDPTAAGVWQALDWLSWPTPASSGSSGPLTFSIGGAIEISGAGRQYGAEVVTCQGTLVGSDGVDYCTLSPNASSLACRSRAVSGCDKTAEPWFNTAAATLQSYVPTYQGSCP